MEIGEKVISREIFVDKMRFMEGTPLEVVGIGKNSTYDLITQGGTKLRGVSSKYLIKESDIEKKEEASFTHRQMYEMMEATRSWTLNKPSGPLPFLPMTWVDFATQEENEKANRSTMPPIKNPHWLIKFLMFLKVL